VELPPDVWAIILTNLASSEIPKIQHINLSFIATTSKQINLICNKEKQKLGIQLMKVAPTQFQQYFASNGFLSLMQYAHENGCEWDKETCKYAALDGHFECLKYAHENGCQWDRDTCNYAACNGHLECLKIRSREWMSNGIKRLAILQH
jgi:hypothetical protein